MVSDATITAWERVTRFHKTNGGYFFFSNFRNPSPTPNQRPATHVIRLWAMHRGLFHSGKVDKKGQLHARCDRSASVIADLARREIGGEDFTYWYLASVHADLEQ